MNIKEVYNKVVAKLGDKMAHLVVGALVGLCLSNHPVLALFAITAMAATKEIYDSLYPKTHTAEVVDALYTVGGGVIGIVVGQVIIAAV